MKLDANQKRKLIYVLLLVCIGGLVGGLYFPPALIITLIPLLGVGGTFLSFDTELSDKIAKYEKPIDLKELIEESFPKDNELQQLVNSNKNDNKKERREQVVRAVNDAYAQQVFFSDLRPKKDGKEDVDLSTAPKP
jgi:hypothetical protein